MLRVRILGLASLFALICLLLPSTALASTKCQCNNGAIAISMDDGDGACDDACDGLGGGQQWQPSDSDEDEDSDATNGETRREERRESGPR